MGEILVNDLSLLKHLGLDEMEAAFSTSGLCET